MTARLSDEELSKMKLGELLERYRIPSGRTTDAVDRCREAIEMEIVKKRDRGFQTVMALLTIPLAIPFFTIMGALMGVATIYETIKFLYKLWF